MMKGKYVIKDGHMPILIPVAMPHDAIKNIEITSAGFFRAYLHGDRLDVAVHGESESLGLRSDPEDAKLIRTFMQMNPVKTLCLDEL